MHFKTHVLCNSHSGHIDFEVINLYYNGKGNQENTGGSRNTTQETNTLSQLGSLVTQAGSGHWDSDDGGNEPSITSKQNATSEENLILCIRESSLKKITFTILIFTN